MTISTDNLRQMATQALTTDDFRTKKEERVQKCQAKLRAKVNELHTIYFNENDSYSIPNSLNRAAKSNRDPTCIKLYMNFNMQNFCGWGSFVPYMCDEYGKNYHARPVNCLKRYLDTAKEDGLLPNEIEFEVWGNKKFTAVFTLSLLQNENEVQQDKFYGDQKNENDDKNDENDNTDDKDEKDAKGTVDAEVELCTERINKLATTQIEQNDSKKQNTDKIQKVKEKKKTWASL